MKKACRVPVGLDRFDGHIANRNHVGGGLCPGRTVVGNIRFGPIGGIRRHKNIQYKQHAGNGKQYPVR